MSLRDAGVALKLGDRVAFRDLQPALHCGTSFDALAPSVQLRKVGGNVLDACPTSGADPRVSALLSVSLPFVCAM